jgi:glycosyltransferase involved in cell wall biosynthesis
MKTRHNILYLTYDGLKDPLGQSQVLPYLEGLAAKGFNITVISFEKSQSPNTKTATHQDRANSRLRFVELKYHKSPPVLSSLYDIYVLKKAVRKVLAMQHIDIIHCRSYITSLVGLWAKKRFGVKFLFDMRGFWADERVEGGLWNIKNPVFNSVYKYFKNKEKEFLLNADATVSLTESAKREIEVKIIPNKQIDITVLTTCTDLQLFDGKNASEMEGRMLKRKHGIEPDEFVLLYLGSLGTWYMLDQMLDFFLELKNSRNEMGQSTKFLFVSSDKELVQRRVRKRELDKDDFIITSCQRSEVPRYIAISDASIFFYINTFSRKATAATKLGEVLAMGKPVITDVFWGDVKSIVTDNQTGILISDFSQEGYRIAISKLNSTNFDSEQIRTLAKMHFSLEAGIEKYHEIYQKLMSN